MAHLLAQIDRTAPEGERDYLLFALLCDAGCASSTSDLACSHDMTRGLPCWRRLRNAGTLPEIAVGGAFLLVG